MAGFGGAGQKSAEKSGGLSGQVSGRCKVANPGVCPQTGRTCERDCGLGRPCRDYQDRQAAVPGDRITVFGDMSADELAAVTDALDVPFCRGLFAGVILQHWKLVFYPLASDGETERAAARAWFGSRGFREVCDHAGVDPAAVMGAFRLHLDMQERAGGELPPSNAKRAQVARRQSDGTAASRRRAAIKGMRNNGLLPPVEVLARIFDGVSKQVIYRDFEVLGLSVRRDVRRAA